VATDLVPGALTTLAVVKEDLGISVATYDDKIKRYINTATGQIERYCGRSFYRVTDQVETKPGYGFTDMRLNRCPINSIASIKYDGSAIQASTYSVSDPDAGIVKKDGGWMWTAYYQRGIVYSPLPGTEKDLYEITYDGGWYTPHQEDLDPLDVRALPYDLENACIDLVRYWWYSKQRDPSIGTERLLSWNVSYISGSSGAAAGKHGLPMNVVATLNLYRRIDHG
jgi:hypothetical protein